LAGRAMVGVAWTTLRIVNAVKKTSMRFSEEEAAIARGVPG
jgi:hypothetical protein